MNCECCMKCLKFDVCDGRCDFDCENCTYNKKETENKDSHKKELNPNYEEKLRQEQKIYRRKHKHCYNCIFSKHVSKIDLLLSFEECQVKDSVIEHPKLKALFCKHYKIE